LCAAVRSSALEPAIAVGDAQVLDVSGRLALPGLVDAHCHLDKDALRGANCS
jgi:cytosine deaminase